jgi:hypothetical protein
MVYGPLFQTNSKAKIPPSGGAEDDPHEDEEEDE